MLSDKNSQDQFTRTLQIDALLHDEGVRRQFFPVTQSKIYFAHAAVAALPYCVTEAIREYLSGASQYGQFEFLHHHCEAETRRLAAQLMNVEADEIALAPSTSAGLSMIAQGLDWNPGDSVVAYAGDFPANLYPWINLKSKGVTVSLIPANLRGAVRVEDVLTHIDEKTRLVSLSTVHYCTGFRIDIEAIAAELRARGILFCLDAIQSLGALPLSMRSVDFAVADAHKWLLGPQGIALMYVRKELFDRLSPVLVGWKSVKDMRDYNAKRLHFADTARRYEPGSLNILGLVGLHAALRLLADIKIENISNRLDQIVSQLEQALKSRGYSLLGPSDAKARTPILAFLSHTPAPQLVSQLADENCVVSARPDFIGRPCIRLSPHFYNTDAEIQQFLALLNNLERRKSYE